MCGIAIYSVNRMGYKSLSSSMIGNVCREHNTGGFILWLEINCPLGQSSIVSKMHCHHQPQHKSIDPTSHSVLCGSGKSCAINNKIWGVWFTHFHNKYTFFNDSIFDIYNILVSERSIRSCRYTGDWASPVTNFFIRKIRAYKSPQQFEPVWSWCNGFFFFKKTNRWQCHHHS